jgi:hypothetical protein
LKKKDSYSRLQNLQLQKVFIADVDEDVDE